MSIIKRKTHLPSSVILFVIIQCSCLTLLVFWFLLVFPYFSAYTNLPTFTIFDLLTIQIRTYLFVCGLLLILLVLIGSIFVLSRLIKQTKINRIYDRFIINITHELKSPLASIQLAEETLEQRDLPDETYFDFLDRIKKDSHRMNHLIGSILEISRINRRKDFFKPLPLPADVIVREVIKTLQNQYGLDESNISVMGHPECRIRIDPFGLTTILSNLIDNSIKYSNSPVRIRMDLEYKKKKFLLLFSDKGIGVENKKRKRIFNQFAQLESVSPHSDSGFGLGLYWCREVLKIHKGKITVQKSLHPTGTSFKIELPAEEDHSSSGGTEDLVK